MTTRHTISNAAQVYVGSAFHNGYSPDGRRGVKLSHLVAVMLGAPDTADTDGIVDGATVDTAATTTLTLALTTLDVPRNITVVGGVDVDGVVTITGADQYGEVMVEQLTANGATPVAGKKAFKTLTSITVGPCTAANTIDVGFGNVLGLPFKLTDKAHLFSPQADGSVEDFTVVAAVASQTATSGDPRGTVTPTTAPNGTVLFSALMYLPDVGSKAAAFGATHYAG